MLTKRGSIVVLTTVSLALLTSACGGRIDQGTPAAGSGETSDSAGAVATTVDATMSAPPETSVGTDPTAGPDTPGEPDHPYTFDFTKPPAVSGPGTAVIASVTALANADLKLPTAPRAVPGMTPTAVFTYWDGAAIQESFVDDKIGPFWFAQFADPPGAVTGTPDACIESDKAQSGRQELANGDTAVIWIATGANPSSITWWHDGVVYTVMGPAASLTRTVAIELANGIMS